jgi:hypothetical protein
LVHPGLIITRLLQDLGDRDAGDAGDAPDRGHHRRVGNHLLGRGHADLRVTLVVRFEHFDLLAEHASLLVPLRDRELHGVGHFLTLLGERPGKRRPGGDLDHVLRLSRAKRHEPRRAHDGRDEAGSHRCCFAHDASYQCDVSRRAQLPRKLCTGRRCQAIDFVRTGAQPRRHLHAIVARWFGWRSANKAIGVWGTSVPTGIGTRQTAQMEDSGSQDSSK